MDKESVEPVNSETDNPREKGAGRGGNCDSCDPHKRGRATKGEHSTGKVQIAGESTETGARSDPPKHAALAGVLVSGWIGMCVTAAAHD